MQQSSTTITANYIKGELRKTIITEHLQSMQCTVTGPEQVLPTVNVHPSKLPGCGCEEQLILVI